MSGSHRALASGAGGWGALFIACILLFLRPACFPALLGVCHIIPAHGCRHVLGPGETLSQLGAKAGKAALEMAGVKPEEIDVVLFATSSPDDLFGTAASVSTFMYAHRGGGVHGAHPVPYVQPAAGAVQGMQDTPLCM